MHSETTKIAILIASHNRRDKTTKCLRSVLESAPPNWEMEIILVDDGSSDGTSTAVREEFPFVTIVNGPGNWFWAKSMAVAQSKISTNPNFVIWMNDDIELLPTALSIVKQAILKFPEAILVGQFGDLDGRKVTYGGLRRLGRHPFKYELVSTKDKFEVADAFHGNFVAIPSSAWTLVGDIDGSYAHAYADYDYALRATSLGIRILVIPSLLGICSEHAFTWPEGLFSRLKFLNSEKGLPIKSQVRYLRKHGPFEWPIYLLLPYIRAILNMPGRSDLHKD